MGAGATVGEAASRLQLEPRGSLSLQVHDSRDVCVCVCLRARVCVMEVIEDGGRAE